MSLPPDCRTSRLVKTKFISLHLSFRIWTSGSTLNHTTFSYYYTERNSGSGLSFFYSLPPTMRIGILLTSTKLCALQLSMRMANGSLSVSPSITIVLQVMLPGIAFTDNPYSSTTYSSISIKPSANSPFSNSSTMSS